MKKTICRALLCLLLAACLLPLTARTAHADKIYDEIVNYQVDVTPNTEDGSLTIQVTLDWKPLEDLPATNSQKGGAKVGIPNGSIREMTALTDNIQSIDYDNSYAYIDFTQSYGANETSTLPSAGCRNICIPSATAGPYPMTIPPAGSAALRWTP